MTPNQHAQFIRACKTGDWGGLAMLVDEMMGVQRQSIADAIARIPILPRRVSSVPSRLLDTPFIISDVSDALVAYTMALSVTLTLLGTSTESASAALNLNGDDIASVKNALSATLTLGLSLNPLVQRKVLFALVPAGSTLIISASMTTNGTVTLVQAQEILLNAAQV